MPEEARKPPRIEASWLKVLDDEFEKPYMQQLRAFLLEEKKRGQKVFPPGPLIFNAFQQTPFPKVRVVILGQDPYHGAGQAHGLSFSVPRGVRPPPSLQNMFKEIHQSLGIPPSPHGELITWAQQGVLLLNTTLTVRMSAATSHSGKGWETFTDRVISLLSQHREDLVFVLWGRHAKSKQKLIDSNRHLVLSAAHPSPLSAHSGFFGCGHFVAINQHLERLGQAPIDWRLPQ